MPTREGPRQRAGISSLYTVIAMVAVCGFVSLGVDFGHVQLAKSQLQTAADAAALAAAVGYASGTEPARNDAVTTAAANYCDGIPVVLDPATDVEFGTWDAGSRTFTSGGNSGVAAIRVTAHRTEQRNSPIHLAFAGIVGRSTCDVRARAVALARQTAGGYGIVGLDSVKINGNSTYSYNSKNGAIAPGATGNKGSVASNGTITVGGNVVINGDLRPGIGQNVVVHGGAIVRGSQTPLTTVLNYPPPPLDGATTSNNNSAIPGQYLRQNDFSMSNGTLTLPGGAYYFTEFRVSGNNTAINFTGPATLYLAGEMKISGGTINTYENLPANLKIRSVSSERLDISSKAAMCADIYAPLAPLSFSGQSDFRGAMVGRSLDMTGGGGIYYDEGVGTTHTPVVLVQ